MITAETAGRPRSLAQLLEALPDGVVRGSWLGTPSPEVAAITIYEAHGAAGIAPGDLVLLVGMDSTPDLLAALGRVTAGAAGVVLRCAQPMDEAILVQARKRQRSVVLLDAATDWMRAVGLLQAALSVLPAGPPITHSRDLFELCDLVAGGVGGPVTIEDHHGNLLAYSRDQTGGDRVRVQTLVARRSPAAFTRALATRGIPKLLLGSDEPLIVRSTEDGVADRVAINLRSGPFQLGEMWAMVSSPSQAQLDAFAELAGSVALELMNRRTDTARARSIELETLAVLLHGGLSAVAIDEAILPQSGTYWVVALDIAQSDSADRAVTRSRLERRLYAASRDGDIRFVVGHLSNLWYLIVNARSDRSGNATGATIGGWLSGWLSDGAGKVTLPVHAGIGRPVSSMSELPRSRREAEQALAVARAEGYLAVPVSFDDCWAKASLQRTRDATLVADLEILTPLRCLRTYDTEHATGYVATLAAWLRCFGNIRAAAEELHVHTNTLRYRLDKLASIAGIDLDDPDVRLVLALQLWPCRPGRRTTATTLQ